VSGDVCEPVTRGGVVSSVRDGVGLSAVGEPVGEPVGEAVGVPVGEAGEVVGDGEVVDGPVEDVEVVGSSRSEVVDRLVRVECRLVVLVDEGSFVVAVADAVRAARGSVEASRAMAAAPCPLRLDTTV
jgi:hypothetical protein